MTEDLTTRVESVEKRLEIAERRLQEMLDFFQADGRLPSKEPPPSFVAEYRGRTWWVRDTRSGHLITTKGKTREEAEKLAGEMCRFGESLSWP